jgi:hypothetical protein
MHGLFLQQLINARSIIQQLIDCFGKEYLRPPRNDELKIPLLELGQYIRNSRRI